MCEVNYFLSHTKCIDFASRKPVCELAESHDKGVTKEAPCHEDIQGSTSTAPCFLILYTGCI